MGWWHKIMGALTGDSGASSAHDENNAYAGGVATAVDAAEVTDEANDIDSTSEDRRWWTSQPGAATEFQQIVQPELTHEARAFENLLISNFDGHNLSLPPMPGTLERVLQNLRNPKCEFAKVAGIIGEDQANAAAVLRMVNSPLYRGTAEITSLKMAITRLGTKALKTLMMHQALRKTTFSGRSGLRPVAEVIWKRSLASAYIMRGLSRFTRTDMDDAFLIGLLHDVGNVIVLRAAQDAHAAGHLEIDMGTFEYFCYAFQQEFGELIATAWSLPGSLKEIIVDHHDYPPEDHSLRTERIQLQLTDMINAMVGYGPEANLDIVNSRAVRDLGLRDRPDFEAYLDTLPDGLCELVESV